MNKAGLKKKAGYSLYGMSFGAAGCAFGVEQFVLHRVTVGYMKGEAVAADFSEIPPQRLPQCAELIDRVEKLHQFILAHAEDLKDTRAIMLLCEDPIFDSASDALSSIPVPADIETAIARFESSTSLSHPALFPILLAADRMESPFMVRSRLIMSP